MRTAGFLTLAALVACSSAPPPASPPPPTKKATERPPRRPGFGGGGAGKAELQAAIDAAKKNDIETTIAKCREAIEKNPNLEQAHLLLGSACSLKDDTKCERLAYEQGVDALPASLALRSELGFLELQQGNFDAAIAQYGKADEIAGGRNADVLAHLGYAHGLAGRMGKAVQLAEKSTSMDAKCARCAAIHGRLLISTKKIDDAVPMLERAVSLAADDIDAGHQLAKAYFLSTKYEQSVEVYARLVKQTGDAGLMNELSVALMRAERYKEAAAVLEKLTDQFPNERTLFERLLEAQTKAGDKKGAKATKKKLRSMK
jgi:tetratricopeptide (TPR) repeat protein